MILKGLPRYFDPFSIYVTYSSKELMFSEFKTELLRDHSRSNNVMKLTSSFSKAMKFESHDISCFTCGGKRHLTKICLNNYDKTQKSWCSYCKSTTHKRESSCYKRMDTIKKGSKHIRKLVRIQNG